MRALRAIIGMAFAWRSEELKGKSPLRSKTVWALLISYVATLIAKYSGVEITPDQQSACIVVVGIAMRLISKGPVGFYEDTTAPAAGDRS